MPTVVAMFNLKPGKSVADYEQWAKQRNLPTVNNLKSVDEYQVYRCLGLLGSGKAAPFQYVELIQVNDMEGLFGDLSAPFMQTMTAEFEAFAVDAAFVVCEAL